MEWQPIETAPKDGTRILVWLDFYKGILCGARWDDDKYAVKPRPYWSTDLERLHGKVAIRQKPPTHWMPLPAAPAEREEQE